MQMRVETFRVLTSAIAGAFLWNGIVDLTIWKRWIPGSIATLIGIGLIFYARYKR